MMYIYICALGLLNWPQRTEKYGEFVIVSPFCHQESGLDDPTTVLFKSVLDKVQGGKRRFYIGICSCVKEPMEFDIKE